MEKEEDLVIGTPSTFGPLATKSRENAESEYSLPNSEDVSSGGLVYSSNLDSSNKTRLDDEDVYYDSPKNNRHSGENNHSFGPAEEQEAKAKLSQVKVKNRKIGEGAIIVFPTFAKLILPFYPFHSAASSLPDKKKYS